MEEKIVSRGRFSRERKQRERERERERERAVVLAKVLETFAGILVNVSKITVERRTGARFLSQLPTIIS